MSKENESPANTVGAILIAINLFHKGPFSRVHLEL